MAEPVLKVETGDGIATLTMNRPQALNALSMELRTALVAAFRQAAADPAVGVVILTGAGRAFSAGLDLNELSSPEAGPGALESAVADGDVVRAMDACDRPILGAVNGFAVTGGFEVALACDLLVASTEARFADTHGRVGILPGWGLSQKLPRLIGIHRAKEVSLTGNFVTAEQALAWGLVNRVVPPAELLPTARAIAADILSCVPEAVRGIKRVMNDGIRTSLAEGMKIEGRASRDHVKSVRPEVIAERRRAMQARSRKLVG